MSTMIRSKPLGYYVNTKRMLFKSFEQKYGSHMEEMSHSIKLQLRASLTNYLAMAGMYQSTDLSELMPEVINSVYNAIWDEYPWGSVLAQFLDESLEDIERFVQALSDQIRSDNH